MNNRTFAPAYGKGITIAAIVTSVSENIDGKNGGRLAVTVTNTGTENLYLKTGFDDVEATPADYILLAGTQVSISKQSEHTHIAVIAPDGDTGFHAISGDGI